MKALSALTLALTLTSNALAAPADPVKFAGVLEQMRGHYQAMLLNDQRGDHKMALKHASHPANELYEAVKNDLPPALRASFLKDYRQINAVLTAGHTSAALEQTLNVFFKNVDAAVSSVPASIRQDPKYGARVISLILGNTKTEYGEGVRLGKVINLAEYQDAQFYLQGAQRWLSQYQDRFPADQGTQTARAIQQAVSLHLAKADPQAFAAQLDRARTELAEISGDTLAPVNTPAADFQKIEALLGKAKVHYKAGMTDSANEALISAYLDHFEQLEAPIALKNKALEHKLEITLRDTLRGLIKQGTTPARFTAAVDAALLDLAAAKALVK